jgi:hypothetical protein
MSTENPVVETAINDILKLRQTFCSSGNGNLSLDIIQRIHMVRDLCKSAEGVDGNGTISWRKGPTGSNGASRGKWKASRGGGPTGGHGQHHHDRPGKYVSKFTNSEVAVEDKILNQVILNKLNKFSTANYNDVKEFLEQILNSDEKEFLHNFMLLVFKKASSEPTFCPLYARMIGELSVKHSSLIDELNDLHQKYMEIFEEVSEEQCSSYEQYVQRNREKIHRLGYSQFLGELASHGVLKLEQLNKLYIMILDQLKLHAVDGLEKQHLVEEYVDCLLRMTRAFQNTKTSELTTIRKELAVSCEPLLEDILTNRTSMYPGLTRKASFTIMDCLDIFRASK